MKKKMKKKELSRENLEELQKDLVTQYKRLRKLEEDNPEVFAKHTSLLETIEGLKERLKIEARKFAEQGETRVVIESPDLFVSVQGRKAPIIYDFAAAKKAWDEKVFEMARPKALDPKAIEKLVMNGKLTQDDVEEISSLGEVPTAAVTVKLIA